MKKYVLLALFGLILGLYAQRPDPQQILRAIDSNLISGTTRSTTRMVINSRRSSRTVTSINYSRGSSDSFTEYTGPPRDRGTKMLKLGSNLWIFDPNTRRTVQISGNMLRQSVMGSDLSYEDFMEESSLSAQYNASLEGEVSFEGRACWDLLLTAKNNQVSYQTKRLYVDKQYNIPLQEKWYARSGRLLKTISASDLRRVGSRWVPFRVVFKDELRQGRGTEYIIENIEFDIRIPDSIFTRSQLSN
ncbi:MAG: outer membrane lipoprotein-sorting protein [Candidatus Cloacimonadota bacterium]